MSINSFATLVAHLRTKSTKGARKQLLASGLVPGIIYSNGKNDEPICITVQAKSLEKLLQEPSIKTRILTLSLDNKNVNVILKDAQFCPMTDAVVHVDFIPVSSGRVFNISVPVRTINKELCPGLRAGGDVNVVNYLVRLACKAEHIPHSIDVDIASASIGDVFYLSGVNLHNSIKKPGKDIMLVKITGKKDVSTADPEKAASVS